MTGLYRRRLWIAALFLLTLLPITSSAQAEPVRAVLFFSPSCPHCHQVINEDLPLIFDQFGGQPTFRYDQSRPEGEVYLYELFTDQLYLLLIDVSLPTGAQLYHASTEQFQVPQERMGVPRLVVGDQVLVGSLEIPQQFPSMIQEGLSGDGLDWPDIPGLAEALAEQPQSAQPTAEAPSSSIETPAPQANPTPSRGGIASVPEEPPLDPLELPSPGLADRLAQDPLGNGLAIAILIGMVLSVLGVVARFLFSTPKPSETGLWVPLLAFLGLLISGYMAYVEFADTSAVCGPVGDCNAVQSSPYAMLFGRIPVAFLGILGYLGLLIAWTAEMYGSGTIALWGGLAQFLLSGVGTLFSIYLTALEPFVLGAVCAWCLSSAILMTLLLWMTADSGFQTWSEFRPVRGGM